MGCRDPGGAGDEAATTDTDAADSTGTTGDTSASTTTSSGADTLETSSSVTDATTSSTSPTTTLTGTDTEDPVANCEDGVVVPGELCFGPPEVIEAGRSTAVLAMDDLDGDGHPDLVAGHDDGLTVRFGSASGTFDAPIEFLDGRGVLAVALGNFDDAPGMDIAAAVPAEDQVEFLFFDGAGFVTGPALESASGPRALARGDFDDDGIDDLAIAHEVSDDIRVVLGNGDGTFAALPSFAAGTAPLGLAAGQLDGSDGDDLAVANFGSGGVGIYRSTLTGFSPPTGYPAQAGVRDVVLADFDDDGSLDLGAIHQDTGTAGFWPGSGDGTLGTLIITPIGAHPRDALGTDLDADGTPDMVVALQSGNAVGVLRGGKGRGFETPEVFGTMSAPNAVAAGDLDGDGALDLVTGSAGPQGGIAVILATP